MRLKNFKKEDHGNSYKQAFIERHIENILERFKEGNLAELKRELSAARYDVFSLTITQLHHLGECRLVLTLLDMGIVFKYLQNLAYLTLTYGAKHVGIKYERSLFGMKMSDAKIFSDCLRTTQSLVYLSLPCNLIDDDLISILIKGLMLNKTIS